MCVMTMLYHVVGGVVGVGVSVVVWVHVCEVGDVWCGCCVCDVWCTSDVVSGCTFCGVWVCPSCMCVCDWCVRPVYITIVVCVALCRYA